MLQLPSAALLPLCSLMLLGIMRKSSSVEADREVGWAGSIHHLEGKAEIKMIYAKQNASFMKTIT